VNSCDDSKCFRVIFAPFQFLITLFVALRFRNGTERLNDIHILNVATSTWTCPRVGGVLPHPRAGMTLTALRGRLFLFGGSGTSSKCFHDLQILDRQEMAWLDVTQAGSGTLESGSNSGGRHGRFEGDQNHHREHHAEADNFRPQWRFGGYDDSSGDLVRACLYSTVLVARVYIQADCGKLWNACLVSSCSLPCSL
jgi:hypothetical protein